MSELLEDIDWGYIIPKDEGTTVHIKILKGKFKDVVYQYGKVGFDEQPDGSVYLKFIYNIVESSAPKEELESDMEFKNHIGDILTYASKVKNDEYLSFGCFMLSKESTFNDIDIEALAGKNQFVIKMNPDGEWSTDA